VNNGRPLTCTSSCHNPHGTRLNAMLRNFDYHQDGNCLMCHAVTKGSRVGIDY
jgi:predicted CXXCH cytochrome family protein